MYYSAYQLLIHSELPLPELIVVDRAAQVDVTIRFASVSPDGLEGGKQVAPHLWATENELYLDITDVARFLISNGNEILIEPAAGADDDSIRLFLLGSAFGALLFQRDLLVIHGNSVRIGEQCLICVGPSGMGKSTLAAAFMRRGFDILADDVVPVNKEGEALPGFPRIKLWQDAAQQFAIDTAELCRVSPQTDKYNLPIQAMEQKALPVRWVYILRNDDVDEISIEPISGMEKFLPLKNNTYRVRFLEGMELKSQHLGMCGKLAGQIKLARITRPKKGFVADKMVDAILNDIEMTR
jgi:hypothetical protein